MSAYVVAFRGQPDRNTTQADEQAWAEWFTKIGPAIQDSGDRVGATRLLPAAETGLAGSSVLTGYVVIEAGSMDEAAELVGSCPGLAGDTDVEIAAVRSA